MIKKTFEAKGVAYASELAILNLQDCLKVLKFNLKNNILVYRLSSECSRGLLITKLHKSPNFNKIQSLLKRIGDFVLEK
jgi:UV DNA damage endonuclease